MVFGSKLETRNAKLGRLWEPILAFRSRVSRWIVGLAAVAGVLLHSVAAFAQGCAMCYNTAAAAKASAIQALRSGILILLIPPVLIFGAVCVFAIRSRNRFNDEIVTDDYDRELETRNLEFENRNWKFEIRKSEIL